MLQRKESVQKEILIMADRIIGDNGKFLPICYPITSVTVL